MRIMPFTHRVPETEIEALRARLRQTRLPPDFATPDWGWGVPLPVLREILAYWEQEFDWRAQEARLFAWPHFTAEIDGLATHFIHARSPHPHATPLIITHGWPGSVFEFLDIIPRLTHPEQHGGTAADAFHIIAPSLPGYAFSAAGSAPGLNQRATAARHAALMAALGYPRYIAQGGDWGSFVAQHTAALAPRHCVGLHLNLLIPVPPADTPDPMALVQPDEFRFLAAAQNYRAEGSGYFSQQSTRPQTLAYALTDSPAGWCAWVAEKFHAWTDCAGDIRNAVSWDAMLANIALYWFTGSIASSLRFYKEYRLAEARAEHVPAAITVPTGIAQYPFDIAGSPRAWAERYLPIIHWYAAPAGGHFAALEKPDLFARDLWRFKERLKEESVLF